MSKQIDLAQKIVVLADDLTGALDAVGPFAARGVKVSVGTDADQFARALETGASVVAVSTRSRDLGQGAAHRMVASVVDRLPNDVLLFKKIDSRLKGNIAAELDAFPMAPLLVVPALPEFQRIQKDRAVSGFGVSDPLPIEPALGRHGARAAIPDVESMDDIDHALAGAAPGTIFVGARALGRALAARLVTPVKFESPKLRGPIAVAVGSYDPITLGQVGRLRKNGVPVLPAPGGRFDGTVPKNAVVVLQATEGPVSKPAAEVASAFAKSFRNISQGCKSLILTGGATAEAVLDEFGIRTLDVIGEIIPGLPISRAGDLYIVTKSGGFGGEDTLEGLVELEQDAACRKK